MSVRTWLAGLAVLVAGIGLAHAADPKGKDAVTYRWVDDKGVVHYGDNIPAQETQKERTILNRQGVEVGKMDAQKSQAQLAEDARRDQERFRLQQHDTFLLTTYTSAKDIEELRDQRLEQLQGQHVAAEQYVQNLNSRMSALQSQAMTFRPYSAEPRARKMPDDLAESLVHTLNELMTQKDALTTKDKEEQEVRTEFDGDIRRYKELRAAQMQPR